MKHTPGPYTIEFGSHKTKIYSQAHLIATVNVFPESPERSRANASLLAAAPIMLDALRKVHGAIEDKDTRRIIEDAIEEAEGRYDRE